MATIPLGPFSTWSEPVALKSEAIDVPCFHARPEGMPRLGLVVAPDIWGIRPLFENIARDLASNGLAVLVVEPWSHLADQSEIETAKESADAAKLQQRMASLQDSVQVGDLETAADFLVINDNISEVAVLGFCMGGMYALKAAKSGRFERAIAFYGLLDLADRATPTFANAADDIESACATLYVGAGKDSLVPIEQIQQLAKTWEKRTDCEVEIYPDAEHGFAHDPDRPTHRDADAKDAFEKTLRFLGITPTRPNPVI